MRAILIILTLLLTVSPASAGWILFRHESGVWKQSGTYPDQKACEADAKAQAEQLKTKTGCADEVAVKKQAEDLRLVEEARRLKAKCNSIASASDSVRAKDWQRYGQAQSDSAWARDFYKLFPECRGQF